MNTFNKIWLQYVIVLPIKLSKCWNHYNFALRTDKVEENAHLVYLLLTENCKQTAEIQIVCYKSSEIALHTELKAV